MHDSYIQGKYTLQVSILNFNHSLIDMTRMRAGRLGSRRTLTSYDVHNIKHVHFLSYRHYFNILKRHV